MERTWRIGEVAERTGLTRRTLRHYDDLGLLVPSSRSWGDYRLYDEGDLLRLLQIQNLKALGLSLPEIAAALADPALDATTTLRSHLDHLEQRISAEEVLARHFHALADATDRSWEDVLAAITLTQRLAHPDPTVRVRAALQSPGTSSSDLFSAFVSESDPGVQEVLIWALAQRPEVGAEALARLDDPDPGLRAALVRLLAKLGDRSAVPALVEKLADPEPRVAALAAQALASSVTSPPPSPWSGCWARTPSRPPTSSMPLRGWGRRSSTRWRRPSSPRWPLLGLLPPRSPGGSEGPTPLAAAPPHWRRWSMTRTTTYDSPPCSPSETSAATGDLGFRGRSQIPRCDRSRKGFLTFTSREPLASVSSENDTRGGRDDPVELPA